MSDLGNRYRGERDGHEVVDVLFSRSSVFSKDRCPTIPSLCDFVMRAGFPKPGEVKSVTHIPGCGKEGDTYRLYIKRDPCPVILLPGMSVCPICGGDHE